MEQALETFTRSIDDESARNFLKSKSGDISQIYDQSDLHNLRILQQTMWDFERFFLVLSKNHRENDEALTALLRLIFSLSFELKSNRLTADHLSNRSSSILGSALRSRRGGEASPLAVAQRRYPEADLDSTALSDETLVDLLVKGIVNAEKIRSELDASSFFVDVAEEPAWRTVWYAYERTEEQFNKALVEMERAFAAREFVVTGEILHVIGIRLWLSSIGVLTKPRSEVIEEAKSYINDIYSDGRIEPASLHESFSDLSFGGYAGLGIHENETSEFKDIFSYLSDKRRAAELDRRPAIAEELLTDMAEDPDRFLRRINLVSGEANEFYNIPVLAAIEPDRFVKVLLDNHPARQRTVLIALKARYEHGNLDRDLSAERSWVNEIRDKLLTATEAMSPITRYRIRQSLKHALDACSGSKTTIMRELEQWRIQSRVRRAGRRRD